MSGSPQFKAEMSSKENNSGYKFFHETETETTLADDEIDIKYEDMDYDLHYNSTADDHSVDHSDLSLETMSSIVHVECGNHKADENDLNDFYHDLFLCERNCDTCMKYMRKLSEHVRAVHAPHQLIQDPLLIDPVLLADQSSPSVQIQSVVDENIFYHDVFLYEQNCETCVTYMRMLSEHVRAAHAPHQPVQDPLLIDDVHVPLTAQPSSSVQIKREVGENIVKMDSCDSGEVSAPTSNLPSREHFQCGECGKSFTRKKRLNTHMSVHTGEKPFKCDVCERRFARSDHLVQHRRIHSGVRPYSCNVCEMSFTVSTSLKEHTRIHTGEKPYKCDVCEKSFKRANHLTVHKRVHTRLSQKNKK